MCPTVVLRRDAADFGLDALGGRGIFPSVFQLVSLIHDFGMGLDDAFAQPRIDISGGPALAVEPRLEGPVLNALAARFPVVVGQNGVLPEADAVADAVMAGVDEAKSAAVHLPMP